MGTQDGPEQQTIAGRALRALRTTRAPVTEEEPVPVAAPVDLTKPEPEAVAEPAAADDGPVVAPAARKRNPVLLAAVIVLAAAVVYAVVAAVVYVHGRQSSAANAAQLRDDALVAARIDIATLRTLDYRDPKAGLQKWLNVTTGDFHDQIAKDEASQEPIIAKAKRVTVGKVVAAVVTDLDIAHRTASVLATVDTTITPAGGTSALDRNRYRATLQQDHGTWKILELALVPVGLS